MRAKWIVIIMGTMVMSVNAQPHRLQSDLAQTRLQTDQYTQLLQVEGYGYLVGFGAVVPSGDTSYATGAVFFQVPSATESGLYVNVPNTSGATDEFHRIIIANPIRLYDNEVLSFGDSHDVTATWDGSMLVFRPATDDLGRVQFGDGTNDIDLRWYMGASTRYVEFDVSDHEVLLFNTDLMLPDGEQLIFGSNYDVTQEFDGTRGALVVKPRGAYIDYAGISDRYGLEWTAGEDGLIQAAASIAWPTATRHFMLEGTNASNDDCVVDATGGLTIETDGSDGDEEIISPHTGAHGTPWQDTSWSTEDELRWEAKIRTGESLVSSIIWAGLKETNTEAVATDDDQVYFRFEDDVDDSWRLVYSIGGTDKQVDTGISCATDTEHHLVIEIDANRVATAYIDGASAAQTTALTNDVDLYPFIGIASDGDDVERSISIREQAISKDID
ncbi:MAG: hypothetical protein DRP01_04925 [Archaeoglobales archaeon]|nr:MAG: hypothetical protein DRP01_04925 [Archaeoglobales archaeon]